MDKKKPLVSILINCFNGEKYLNEALESVKKQTYTNWELIFWDNQSSDNSAEIFHKYKDKRMIYHLSDQFTDLGGARAKASKYIRGDYLAILDCDDIWFPKKLQVQLDYLKDPEYGICISNPLYFNSRKSFNLYKKKPPQGNVTKDLIENYYVVLPSILLKMEYVNKLNCIFNKEYSHIADFDLIVRVSTLSKLVYCPETLAGWRIHAQNSSFLESEKFVIEKLKWIRNARLNKIFKDYQNSINNLDILTKAEGCNIKRLNTKLNIIEIIKFSGNLKSRIKVYISFLQFLYKLFSLLKKIFFSIRWRK